MKKIFNELNEDNYYSTIKKSQTKNYGLEYLWLFLCHCKKDMANMIYEVNRISTDLVKLDKTEDGKMVYLWDSDNIKEQGSIEGLTPKQQEAFDEAYSDYVERRREDMVRLDMTIENYIEIVHKWNEIVINHKPRYQYVIMSQDDTGYVDIVGKNELSEQDRAEIEYEHQKYLQHDAAYHRYRKTLNSGRQFDTFLWYGPSSSEFESEIQKYIDVPNIVKKKINVTLIIFGATGMIIIFCIIAVACHFYTM